MADKKLMNDSSILIDYFRKTNKNNSKLINHFKNYDYLYIFNYIFLNFIGHLTDI
jgi:tRNA(fMet)-specific endonuclease VapC